MRIFLSSTYMDLILHRKAVVDALERLDLQAGRMEVFGARPEEPVTACLTEVAECDLFIGLYAHRYGFIPAGSDASITEAEFDHARKANKPIFCFVVDDDHPWPPKMMEDEPGKVRLQAFKAKVSTSVVRDTFTTPEDLAVKLATTIGRYLSRKTPVPRDVEACRREVQVRRVTDSEDEDLDEAFILYERRIPDPNLRDNSADIRRWLGELRDEKAAGIAELDDYLLIALMSGHIY